MIKEENTIVYLTEQDALLFAEFQKRYAFIRLLDSIGGFNIKSGSLTVHFDNLGQIANVEKREHFKA